MMLFLDEHGTRFALTCIGHQTTKPALYMCMLDPYLLTYMVKGNLHETSYHIMTISFTFLQCFFFHNLFVGMETLSRREDYGFNRPKHW